MSRCLLLAVVAACNLGHAGPEPAVTSIETWLDHWAEARRCLVADAETTQTGVTMAMLLGRTCHDELRVLVETTSDAVMPGPRLVDNIWLHPSVPAQRTAAIELVDRFARDLGKRVGRNVSPPRTSRPLPVLQPKQRIDVDGAMRVSGGVIRLFGETETVIDQTGAIAQYSSDRTRHVIKPDDGRRESHVANAESGQQRISVWSLQSSDHAYEIEISSDGGATWTLVEAPKGTTYLDSWQDPLTRAIEIAVGSEKSAAIHRITAKQPTPVVGNAPVRTAPGFVECANDGKFWSLGHNAVQRFGEPSMRIKSWASFGGLDCRGTTALVLGHWPDTLERCTDRCEQVFASPNTIEGRSALLDDGRWVYAAELDQIVAVWTERAAEPTFHRLPKPATIAAMTVLKGQVQLVIDDGKTRELVPL